MSKSRERNGWNNRLLSLKMSLHEGCKSLFRTLTINGFKLVLNKDNFVINRFIGGFFHTQNVPQTLNHAAKSATMMLMSGTAGIVYTVSSAQDNMATKTAAMVISMATGAVVYNGQNVLSI